MIHIIATAVKSGKGGISTALIGFCESDILRDKGVNIIESHNQNRSKWESFQQAKRSIREQVKPGDIVWIHCARWLSMVRKYALAKQAKRQGARVFFQFHSVVTADYSSHFLGRLLLRKLYSIADGICVLSEWWRELLVERLAFASERIHVVANPLDKQLEDLARKADYTTPTTSPLRLLAMTRLVHGKNVDAVVEAMRILPKHYHLTIAGDGNQKQVLEQLVESYALGDRVHFTGWVDYDKKLELLAQQDLFVLPSQFDAFGMGFLEAMAAGLPVVALRTGPTADVVPDQEVGYLVDDCKPSSIAKAVEACFADHQRFSSAGRDYVLSHYTTDKILPDLIAFFNRDLGAKPSLLGELKQQFLGLFEPFQRLRSKHKLPLRYYHKVINVGDGLNPYLMEHLTGQKVYRPLTGKYPHILGMGSILHVSTSQSQVWGSGLIAPDRIPIKAQLQRMQFHAVRGYFTQEALARGGADVTNTALGDPAVLLSDIYKPRAQAKRYRVGIVPHYVDTERVQTLLRELEPNLAAFNCTLINVQQAPEAFIDALNQCDIILSSSLHGLILADTYNIPNVWVSFSDKVGGGDFKFNDYFSTTSAISKVHVINDAEALHALLKEPDHYSCVRQFTEDKTKLRNALPTQF